MVEVRFDENCTFCKLGKDGLTRKVRIEDPRTGKFGDFDCDRGFYENSKHCIVTLAPEQYSIGHTLVILQQHAEDMSEEINPDEYVDLCNTLREVSKILKSEFKAKRVYVCSLCDGVKHLHFHLIPRYETDTQGFNFMGDREKRYQEGFVVGCPITSDNLKARAKWIELIAEKIRK